MKIAINAMPIRHGGGLIVVRGLIQSLKEVAPDCEISILTSAQQAYDEIQQQNAADHVERILPEAGTARLFLWQNLFLGRWLKQRGIDALISVNYFVRNVACPQLVYHLNLLRFCRDGRQTTLGAQIKDWLRDLAARDALTRADTNVFESKYLQDAAQQVSRQPINNPRVVYIGLPAQLLSAPTSDSGRPSSSCRLVAITTSNPHKDNETLVRTLAQLTYRDAGSNWQLDIAGGSEEKWQSLRRYAEQWRVLDRITWHGYCDNDQLTQLLQNALCLVSTSLVESFAMVGIEAMARGCPPVVADCASMPESIGPAGLLAEPGSAESFADQILKLTRQPELREQLVRRGYEWIRQFRWINCGRQFHDLIRELLPSSRNHLAA